MTYLCPHETVAPHTQRTVLVSPTGEVHGGRDHDCASGLAGRPGKMREKRRGEEGRGGEGRGGEGRGGEGRGGEGRGGEGRGGEGERAKRKGKERRRKGEQEDR